MVSRGPFVVAHALREIKPHHGAASRRPPGRLALQRMGEQPEVPRQGPVIDVLDPDLPVLEDIQMAAGRSGIFRLVKQIMEGSTPAVLHCTHRLMEQTHDDTTSRIVIRGPAETPAVVRLFTAQRTPAEITVRSVDGKVVESEVFPDEGTHSLLIRFGNVPEGAVTQIVWAE
jgi:hypothetical protein